jgi:hypothetical protein
VESTGEIALHEPWRSTKGNGSRRDRSISSADAWICGASPLAASMNDDEAAPDMEPPDALKFGEMLSL